jgi:hypothetical protein
VGEDNRNWGFYFLLQNVVPCLSKAMLIAYLCNVKKLLSRRHILIVAILQCIFFCAGNISVHASQLPVAEIKKEISSSTLSANLPDADCNPINILSAGGSIIPAGFKNNHTVFLDFSSFKKQDARLSFSGYIFYSRHLLIRLLKSNIIFPFHYFW